MTKKEKQILRNVVFMINDLIIQDNKKKVFNMYAKVRRNPEKYSKEFITEMSLSKEEQKRLIDLRKKRLKEQE